MAKFNFCQRLAISDASPPGVRCGFPLQATAAVVEGHGKGEGGRYRVMGMGSAGPDALPGEAGPHIG